MYGSPFCYHEFTAEQLAAADVVTCGCGHTFKSAELSEFNRIKKAIEASNLELGTLVKQMAAFNAGTRVEVAAPVPEVVRPPKPKRAKITLSVTQWLIVGAGFLVLVAASVFVSQNLTSWNVYGWSTLELVLGVLAGFGAFKLKKFSVLLTNFLAVFSSAMLLTLIMSFSTTFGLGFDAWDREPAWFWSVNLATVAVVSLGLGMVSKNFGWRAVAPLSLTASAIILVVNSSGTFEDRWRVAVLSVALFAILITVRLARNARWEVPKGDDAEYMADLQQREDNSLKRFGLAIAVLLAGLATLATLQQLALNISTTIDWPAALVTAVVWLVGARINQSWVNAIVDKDETILTLRNTASTVGLSFLGLGTLAAVHGFGTIAGISVAVALLLLVFALENYAKFLLLPKYAVTVSAWITGVYGFLWFLTGDVQDFQLVLGAYLIGVTLALTSREFYSFSSLRSIAVYVTGFAGTLSIYFHAIQKENHEGVVFAIYFGLALVFVNLVPVLVSWLRKRFEVEEPEFVAYIPLIQSSLITLVAVPSFVSLKNDLYLLFVAAGFLVLTLVGRLKLKSAKLLEAVGNQSFVAIGISILLTALGANIESLKVDSAFILFEGLAIFGYALLAKNIRWANIGFAVTSLSILLAYSAWGTSKDNVVYFAVGAMLIGGVVNLGLIWATKKFSKESTITKLVTRITTGLSLLFIVVAAHRFIPLDEQSIWLLAAAPLVLALGIEIRKSNNFVFIYLGAALVASIPTGTDETYVSYFARVTVIALALAFAFIRRARSSGRIAWAAAAQLAAAFVAGFAAHTVDLQYKLNWRGPELYSVSIAILLGIAAWLTKKANSKAHQYLQLDVPVLVAAVPSLFFALIDFAGSTVESANRFVLAAGVIWGHNIWRGFERRKFGWLVAQSITGVIFGVAVARAVYENFQIVWSGPEIYSLAIFGTALVAIRLAGQMDLLKGSLVRFGLPVAILLTPSAIYSWSSVTRQFSELNATEITRTLLVLVLAIAVMVFGILRGNRGLNIVGTVELWLIAIPGLWFKTSAVDNGSADLELRGLLIAALAYWVISLVRQFTDAKLKSVIWIGIPVSIALAPAIFHTLSSLGSSELRTVDWWRFSIVLSASLVLLMVGALREIGGTFFPGLIGVLVTVLPYGFTPVTNKEWYLWAILLGVAGLLVWLAVRLENMRKAGREPSAWLRELK